VVPGEDLKGLALVNYRRHVAAYLFALRRLRPGWRVLDYGCGSGHGTKLLSGSVAGVVGVDVAPEAIAHARERFAAPNAEYRVTDPATLKVPDGAFHAAVSVQVFEHIADSERHAAEVARVLRPGGLYVVATPNALTYGAENEHHEREYDAEALREVLLGTFPSVEVIGLHAPLDLAVRPEVRGSEFEARLSGLPTEALPEAGSESFSWDAILPEHFPVSARGLETCLDLLAVCRKG